MKHLKILFTLLCAIVCCQSAMAYEEVTIDGIKYSLYGYNKQAFVCNNDYSGDVVIPATVSYENVTYDVTTLLTGCFRNCTTLTSVSIPESVTSLPDLCFWNCSGLTKITIPESVTSLGNWCFYECESLTSLTLPESVTSLGHYCFARCSKLTDFTIPESVTSLDDNCFALCESLTSITIPTSVTSLGDSCFFWCSSLENLKCRATTPPALGTDCFGKDGNFKKMYVPGKSLEAYRGDASWSLAVEHIYPFVEKIEMPASVTIAKGEEQTLDFTLLPEEADVEALQ